jgi:hypothetical protein
MGHFDPYRLVALLLPMFCEGLVNFAVQLPRRIEGGMEQFRPSTPAGAAASECQGTRRQGVEETPPRHASRSP